MAVYILKCVTIKVIGVFESFNYNLTSLKFNEKLSLRCVFNLTN